MQTARTYLVTGVGGFIASEVARKLLARGDQVVGVDNFSLGYKRNVPDGIEFVELDLSNLESSEAVVRGNYEAILHLAGQSGGELSFSDPFFDLDANARSVHVVLELAKRSGGCPVVYASSVATYGHAAEGELLEETKTANPLSPYGVSKLAGEGYLKTLGSHLGIPTSSLRLFNVYGEGQDLSRLNQGMLSIYLSQALASGQVEVKGSIDRYRDFVHVSDAAEAFLIAADYLSTNQTNDVFNICTGLKTTVAEALEVLQAEFSGGLEINLKGSTPGDAFGWVGSRRKAADVLGWQPKVAFVDGFKKMIRAERSKPLAS